MSNFTRPWETREYAKTQRFEDELNEYIAHGYGLHSWNIVPLGSIIVVYAKLQNAPEKPQGIRAR